MRTSARAAGCLVVVLAGSYLTHAQKNGSREENDSKASVLRLEEENLNAELKGDKKVLNALYADDFSGINAAGGKTDRNQIINFYSDSGPVLSINKIDDVSVRVIGKAVVVTARLKYQYNDKYDDRKVNWLRYMRVYDKRAVGWQIVAEQFTFTDEPSVQDQK